jgi:hypothetical protein
VSDWGNRRDWCDRRNRTHGCDGSDGSDGSDRGNRRDWGNRAHGGGGSHWRDRRKGTGWEARVQLVRGDRRDPPVQLAPLGRPERPARAPVRLA